MTTNKNFGIVTNCGTVRYALLLVKKQSVTAPKLVTIPSSVPTSPFHFPSFLPTLPIYTNLAGLCFVRHLNEGYSQTTTLTSYVRVRPTFSFTTVNVLTTLSCQNRYFSTGPKIDSKSSAVTDSTGKAHVHLNPWAYPEIIGHFFTV